MVVYFESQSEADDFELVFQELEANETGEKDFNELRETLGKFERLDFKTDDEREALDANRIRQIFEKAELDLAGNGEQWQEAFLMWLKEREVNDDSPEVPRGVFKIIEVENGKAIIQGDDIDRRFVPEPDNEAEDYPFEVPSNDAISSGLEDSLELSSPVDGQNDGASVHPASDRLSRWAAILAGKETVADQVVDDCSSSVGSSTGFATTTSALGLLGLVLQRNAKSNRSASDEIEDFAKAKLENPERNIFSNAARFRRRNRRALQDGNQEGN